MVDILPIPENYIFVFGLFKLLASTIALVLFILLINKALKRPSRIINGFIFTFLFLILANISSSFDNLFGWRDLLGPDTWLGYGLSQIFTALANIGYFWLYIDIFQADSNWKKNHKIIFFLFSFFEVLCSVLMMTHYLIGFPSNIMAISILFISITAIVYIMWIKGSSRLLKRVQDKHFVRKFKCLLIMSVLFFIVIIFVGISGMSESPSFATVIGMIIMLIAMAFAYIGIIQD
jgi:hypothetical protein